MAAAGLGTDGMGRRGILVVDDHPDVRESLEDLLEAAGFRVTAVDGAQSALDYLGQGAQRTDVILLDFAMPGMTGADLVAAMASRPAMACIPVVFLTADERARAAAAATGCECLSKPLDLGDLMAALDRHFVERRP